jgi:hypothetical protein
MWCETVKHVGFGRSRKIIVITLSQGKNSVKGFWKKLCKKRNRRRNTRRHRDTEEEERRRSGSASALLLLSAFSAFFLCALCGFSSLLIRLIDVE